MNKTFLEELSIDDDAPISVACDNTAARDTAYNPEHQSSVRKKVKHIERRHFYVRTRVHRSRFENHKITVPYVNTVSNLADFFIH